MSMTNAGGINDSGLNPVPTERETSPNVFEAKARDKKCRLTIARMLTHLAGVLTKPGNENMIANAAMEAGQHEFSEKDSARLIELLDQLAGRLSRGEK
jgi:hypothetical protein